MPWPSSAPVWLESDERKSPKILVITETGTIEKALQLLKTRAAPQGAVPTYTTLAGNTVRSLQEVRISNWLTLMGINYEYERGRLTLRSHRQTGRMATDPTFTTLKSIAGTSILG